MALDDSSDDLALLRRVRGGDEEALRALMVRYDRLVRYGVFRLCRSECRRDVEFLDSRASETWSGFVESVRRPDSALPRNVKTYLLQIVRNKCTDALRRTRRGEAGLEDWNALQAPAETAVETLIRAEQIAALQACVKILSYDEQDVYSLLELILDGRWKQAGESLGMPESTLRTRWPGILAKLRACVEGKTGKTFARSRAGSDS